MRRQAAAALDEIGIHVASVDLEVGRPSGGQRYAMRYWRTESVLRSNFRSPSQTQTLLAMVDQRCQESDNEVLSVPYRRDLITAARRHLRAAQLLYDTAEAGARPGCRAVAGYLFGLAGELAVKQMMRTSGMKELPQAQRSDDPFYSHFPELKTQLTKAIQGRRAGELRQIAEDPRLFQHWNTNMRYAPTADIKDNWIESWKVSAEGAVEKMCLT